MYLTWKKKRELWWCISFNRTDL